MFQTTKQIWNSVDMLTQWFTDALDSIWLKHDLKDKTWLIGFQVSNGGDSWNFSTKHFTQRDSRVTPFDSKIPKLDRQTDP
jgi:hypothetical protein